MFILVIIFIEIGEEGEGGEREGREKYEKEKENNEYKREDSYCGVRVLCYKCVYIFVLKV